MREENLVRRWENKKRKAKRGNGNMRGRNKVGKMRERKRGP